LVRNVLGEGIHVQRELGFCLAREALKACFLQRGIQLEIPDLLLEKFSAVKGQSSLTISLSHAKDWGAAVVASTKEVISVGIDIEPKDRVVKPIILERISHPEDSPLPPLMLWSLKEASFKALINTGKFEKPVEFSGLKITQGQWLHEASQIHGEWKVDEEQGLIIALAWIKI
jgi:phosphopantetheinyl transferase (holo-ACP synthase)